MQQWIQDITLLATSFISASRKANLLKNLQIVDVLPEVENTKGVKHPISTSQTRFSYFLCFLQFEDILKSLKSKILNIQENLLILTTP